MSMINWNTSKGDTILIQRISERARDLGVMNSAAFDINMDTTACHANGCPLDLASLVDAPTHDFVHDVGGIMRNIDRRTGKLMNAFRPRYAASNRPGGDR